MSKFSTPYTERVRVSPLSDLPSRTMQQFADEADVNVLIARYQKTGSFYSPLNPRQGEPRRPMFEDLASLPDVEEAQAALIEAQDIFASLPSSVREQFANNPAEFVSWAQNPANLPTLAKLGVIELPDQEAPTGADQPAPAVEAQLYTSADGASAEGGKPVAG